MNDIRQSLSQFMSLADEEFDLIKSKLEVEEIKTNAIIIKINQKVSKLYFVKSGLLRTYFLSDGKEINTYFACNGQFITSFSSYITQTPSIQYLEALESSTLYSITFEQLNNLYESYPKFEKFGKILAEQNYLCVLERMIYLQSKSAKEKYLYFIEKYEKKIVQRVPQLHIASYLGITPETLSRVRKEISIS
jgi:CRP-like cAMP-binding protein